MQSSRTRLRSQAGRQIAGGPCSSHCLRFARHPFAWMDGASVYLNCTMCTFGGENVDLAVSPVCIADEKCTQLNHFAHSMASSRDESLRLVVCLGSEKCACMIQTPYIYYSWNRLEPPPKISNRGAHFDMHQR